MSAFRDGTRGAFLSVGAPRGIGHRSPVTDPQLGRCFSGPGLSLEERGSPRLKVRVDVVGSQAPVPAVTFGVKASPWLLAGGDPEDAASAARGAPGGCREVSGNVLEVTPPNGARVRVPAYVAGINDDPIICGNSTYHTLGYTSFNCHSYYGGTSGAPFVRTVGADHHQVVGGVIGGLHQGGCFEETSHSSLSCRHKPDLGPCRDRPPSSCLSAPGKRKLLTFDATVKGCRKRAPRLPPSTVYGATDDGAQR